MKKSKPCKRGNIAERDKGGHCLCRDCKEYNYQRQKETRAPCYLKDWQAENKEKVAEYTKKWNSRNKKQRKAIVKLWRSNNPDKVAAINAKGGKKWVKNNPGIRLASVRGRQAAKLKRTPIWSDKEAIKLVYIESQRITKETGVPHEVDHIYPLQGALVSGLHVHENLQIITMTKNRKKGNK